jgi:imidazoleglycerol phosphate synthase glutamine amidotransferase subunit HisH
MATIANMPGADVQMQMPSGEIKNVNMIVMLVETQNAEFKRDHGMFLPGVGKLHPTIKALREKYELDYFFDAPVKTWKDCAAVMRHVYSTLEDHIKAQHG